MTTATTTSASATAFLLPRGRSSAARRRPPHHNPSTSVSTPCDLRLAGRRRRRVGARPSSSAAAAAGRGGSDGDDAATDCDGKHRPRHRPRSEGAPFVIPALVYAVVPYLPPALLFATNDSYLSSKRNFDALASSLPLPPALLPRDSADYLSLSSSYDNAMHSLLVLLVSKRLALYFLATVATAYAGWRAHSTGVASVRRGTYGGPGDALDGLNREVLEGERRRVDDDVGDGRSSGVIRARDEPEDDAGEGGASDIGVDDDNERLFAALIDDGPRSSEDVGTLLALALPLVLGASLALSYLATATDASSLFLEASSPGEGGGIIDATTAVVREGLSRLLPALSSFPGAALSLLFVAAEFRWAVQDGFGGRPPATTTTTTMTTTTTTTTTTMIAIADPRRQHPLLCAGNALAFAYVAGAYLAKVYPTLDVGPNARVDLWPLQNGVNVALAASVARALSPFLLAAAASPPRPPAPSSSSSLSSSSTSSTSSSGKKSIRTVALAMLGLALFDAVATFGTVANAASAVANASPPASVMEAVARSKLASWQPGLLEVIVGHDNSQVTEALGLGDVVFPSVLVAWGFAADDDADDAESVDGRRRCSSIDDGFDNGSDRCKHISLVSPYASASILGYLFGSLVTEIVGSFALLGTRSGLPALVFLIPSMLGAVTAMAWSRNELRDVWGAAIGNDDEES